MFHSISELQACLNRAKEKIRLLDESLLMEIFPEEKEKIQKEMEYWNSVKEQCYEEMDEIIRKEFTI